MESLGKEEKPYHFLTIYVFILYHILRFVYLTSFFPTPSHSRRTRFFYYNPVLEPTQNDTLGILKSLYISVFTHFNNTQRIEFLRKHYIESFISLTSYDNFILNSKYPSHPLYKTIKAKPFFPQKLRYVKDKKKIDNNYFNEGYTKMNDTMTEIMNNRMSGFQYCLSKANCRWLLNVGDDAYVHVPRLEDYLKELEDHYDPLKEAVIEGNCIYYTSNDVYLQGGSGFILSRKALQLIFDVLNGKRLDIDFADDALITNLFMQAGLTLSESASGRFIGMVTDINNINDWEKRLPKCEKPSGFMCARDHYQVNKLVVFHPFRPGEMAEKILRLVDASSSVYIEMACPFSHACRRDFRKAFLD